MAITEYPEAFLIVLFLLFLHYLKITRFNNRTSSIPTNWPFLGMLPALLHNAPRVHDFATEALKEVGGTFLLKGPWFSNSDMLVTSDPANVHHVLSRNFANYPKGPMIRESFDVLGDGIFSADDEVWEIERKTTMELMKQDSFNSLLEETTWSKIEKGLIPILDYFCKNGADFDLQDIFQRFTFDGISKLLLGHDPECLSIGLPQIPCEKGLNDAVEALLYRNIFPRSVWKLQKKLGIGKERKLSEAWQAFDEFIYPFVSMKTEDSGEDSRTGQEERSMLTGFLKSYCGFHVAPGDSKKFLRDTVLNLMVAGRDTTSTALTWLFWLLDENPSAKAKILEEIEAKLGIGAKESTNWRPFSVEDSRKLVYLHGALCESLRLYPPVSIEGKSPDRTDVLPSGHRVDPGTRVILHFYTMARMEALWGKDCLEFKPERWISERGGIKHEPSYKFPAFNAGPRTCVGKDMAFIQMKMVAATIIYNYHVHIVKGHPVSPSPSLVIQMTHGLKVRFTRRSV